MVSAPPTAHDSCMESAQVIVSASAPNLHANGVASAVEARDDMSLVASRVVTDGAVLDLLEAIPSTLPCAVIRVGSHTDEQPEFVRAWQALRRDLVLLHVDLDVEQDEAPLRLERFAVHDTPLDSMLHALHELLASSVPAARVLHFRLHAVASAALPETAPPARPQAAGPVLASALGWIHALLLAAVRERSSPISIAATSDVEDNNQWVGFGISATTVLRAMDSRGVLQDVRADPQTASAAYALANLVRDADVPITASTEPLAAIGNCLALTALELQLLLLALAPEFDARYQRCMAVLLDESSRRVGTFGLYAELLGEPVSVMRSLLASGGLARWRLLQQASVRPNSDDPLRADPHLCAWLLGDAFALDADPHLQRLLRAAPWRGADLLKATDKFRASTLIGDLRSSRGAQCTLFEAESPTYAMALLEHGSRLRGVRPLRVDAQRLTGLEPEEVTEAGWHLGRAALLTDRPLLLSVSAAVARDESLSRTLATLLTTLATAGCRYGVVSAETNGLVHLLGAAPFELQVIEQGKAQRLALVRTALDRLGAPPDDVSAQFIAANFPLQIDGFDAALALALHPYQGVTGQTGAGGADDETLDAANNGIAARDRFIAGCKAIAMQNVSNLAERIEPGFEIDDVVLPNECAAQLREIVASVRLAPMVLDQWNFRRQLPYGRGTTVLFHGPSGTGKTMAAHGVAKALNVHVLRLDLSRVVSKYIGETEKHCDQVFDDATASGAAILIDEADALFGKRSEVKDAHDRHANIEVAFLLQRIETFEGLAILTTNLRQNLDPAFLRRLRFIVEFPRPDVQARAAIWQACLPKRAHRVSPAEVGELARRIDLTGGHIRQITLRAAFLAASRGSLIEVADLVAATRSELAKLGMSAAGLGAVVAPARRVA